ncbi:YhdP family protein [Arhodomonas sp. AD133]|uniref:YhdP family protein n=1 Tax=Arhodomonas sp. AD133 TaxID=3415009 RepID=UPI003EBE5602
MSGKRVASLTLYLSAIVLAFVAVAGLGLRWAVSHAERFREPLAAMVAERLGTDVSVGAVDGRVRGWRPELDLHDVVIGSGDARLSLPRVTITVAPWASLRTATVRVGRLTAEGAALTVRHGDGVLWTGPGDAGAGLSLQALPERFALRNGVVRLTGGPDRRRLTLTDVDADITRHDDGEIAIAARASAPDVVEGNVTIRYRGGTGAGAGRSYLNARRVRLGALAGWLPERVRPRGLAGNADVELWTRYSNGRLRDVRASVSAENMTLHGVTANALSGRARWRPASEGWRLDVRGWQWRTADSVGRIDALAVAGDERGWRLAAPALNVAPLRALALSVPALPAQWAQPLGALRAGGSLRQVRAAVAGEQWRATARLADIAIAARGKWPGFGGLSGTVTAGDRGGHFTLEAKDSALDLPWLFREPLPYDRLTASGTWRHRDDGLWRVAASSVRVASPDGRLRGRAAAWFGVPDGPFLDIAAALDNGDGRHASRYYPAGVMPDKLVGWLDQAIGGGHAPHAEALVYGPARRFPFRGGEGHFHIRGRAEDVPFSYRPDWPAVSDASGWLEFENESMHIQADAGHIFGVTLAGGEARIAELEHDPVLNVDLRARGPTNDMLRYLRESPLGGKAPPLFDALRIDDDAPLSLALEVPLKRAENTRVDGAVTLDSAGVSLEGHPYSAQAVGGRVTFSERGFAWEDLRGRFAGEPWVSRARTEAGSNGARIVVDGHFSAGVDDLLPQAGEQTAAVDGETQWLVQVDAPGFPPHGRSGPVRINVDSDLRGLALDLPDAWGKSGDEALSLGIEATVDGSGFVEPVRARLGDRADLRVDVAGDTLRRLAVGLGGVAAPDLLQGPGTVVRGQLQRLPWAWITPDGGGRGAEPAWLPLVREVDLNVGRIGLGGYSVGEAAVSARRDGGGWQVTLQGPDIAGTLRVPERDDADRPVEANLQHVHLHSAGQSGDDEPGVFAAERLPSLALTAESVQVDGRALGRLSLRTHGDGPQARLEQLELRNPELSLSAEGARGKDGRSQLHVEARSPDAGAALTRLGFPDLLRGGNGTLNAELSWPGALTAPTPVGLNGQVMLTVTDGVLPAVEPGAGRLLGLLSVALLPRRLLLDFSDVTNEGLVFDHLVANLQASDGVLQPEAFFLEGPAGRIDVAGSVDLVAERLDQTVTVTPNISSTLPLLGLAGGPQTAILVFLAERLFGGGVDRLSRYRYRVTGSIDDPRVEPLGLERSPATEDEDDASPLHRR